MVSFHHLCFILHIVVFSDIRIYLLIRNNIFQKLIDMSKKNANKIVKIAENKLVDLIDNIVTEAVAQKKTEWLAEQANTDEKNTLLEGRLSKLESFISRATITKKKK